MTADIHDSFQKPGLYLNILNLLVWTHSFDEFK